MKRNHINIILAVTLIIVAAVMRIVTREMHLYNIAPVAAVGLFSGAVIKDKKFAYLLPLFSMFIADLYFSLFTSVNGFYGIEQLFVYGGMALVTLLGTQMHKVNILKVAGFSIGGSCIFFIVSNFGSFISGMYGYGFDGLVKTYVMAIPFFRDSFLPFDLLGNSLLFGLYFLAQRAFAPKLQQA